MVPEEVSNHGRLLVVGGPRVHVTHVPRYEERVDSHPSVFNVPPDTGTLGRRNRKVVVGSIPGTWNHSLQSYRTLVSSSSKGS